MQYDEHKLVEYFADAPAGVGFSDLDLNNIPDHISCIMDGNGRWSQILDTIYFLYRKLESSAA